MTTLQTESTALERMAVRIAKAGGQHFYVLALGLEPCGSGRLRRRIEEGLAFESFSRLQSLIDLPRAALGKIIGVPARTLARRKDEGSLRPDESDHLVRVARIVGLALRLFEGDLDFTRSWLLTPHASLGAEPPLELATTDIGGREVEDLIGRLEHGIPL